MDGSRPRLPALLGLGLSAVAVITLAFAIADLAGWRSAGAQQPSDLQAGPAGPFVLTNDTGQAASGLEVLFSGTNGSLEKPGVSDVPGCPAPSLGVDGDTVTVDWGAKCVDPGEEVQLVVFSTSHEVQVASVTWTNDRTPTPTATQAGPTATPGKAQQVFSFTNDTGDSASDLEVLFNAPVEAVKVITQPQTCGPSPAAPDFPNIAIDQNEVTVDWVGKCVPPGGKVTLGVISQNEELMAPVVIWTNLGTPIPSLTPTRTPTRTRTPTPTHTPTPPSGGETTPIVTLIFTPSTPGATPPPVPATPNGTRYEYTVVNRSVGQASQLDVHFIGSQGTINHPEVKVNPDGCPAPTAQATASSVKVVWGQKCVAQGAAVTISLYSKHPITMTDVVFGNRTAGGTKFAPSVSILRIEKTKNADGTMTESITVRNEGTKKARGYTLTSQPYDGEKWRRGETPTAGGAAHRGPRRSQSIDLQPGEQRKFTFTWTTNYDWMYADVYRSDVIPPPGSTTNRDYGTIGPYHNDFRPITVRPGSPQQFSLAGARLEQHAFPFAYPLSMAGTGHLDFFIEVTGMSLPPGWALVSIDPPPGEPFPMDEMEQNNTWITATFSVPATAMVGETADVTFDVVEAETGATRWHGMLGLKVAELPDPAVAGISGPAKMTGYVGELAIAPIEAVIRNNGSVGLQNVAVALDISNVECYKQQPSQVRSTQWGCFIDNTTRGKANDLDLTFPDRVRSIKSASGWNWRVFGTDQDNTPSDCDSVLNTNVEFAGESSVQPGGALSVKVEMCSEQFYARRVRPREKVWTSDGNELAPATSTGWAPSKLPMLDLATGSLAPGGATMLGGDLQVLCLAPGPSAVFVTAEVLDVAPAVPDATYENNILSLDIPVNCLPSRAANGDSDGDGLITSLDAFFDLQYTAALIPSLPCFVCADVNNDGVVDSRDALLKLQRVAGLIDRLKGEAEGAAGEASLRFIW